MTKQEFKDIVAKTPRFVPVFRLKKVPDWMKRGDYPFTGMTVEVGDEFYPDGDSFISMKDVHKFSKRLIRIAPTYLEFVHYKNIND